MKRRQTTHGVLVVARRLDVHHKPKVHDWPYFEYQQAIFLVNDLSQERGLRQGQGAPVTS